MRQHIETLKPIRHIIEIRQNDVDGRPHVVRLEVDGDTTEALDVFRSTRSRTMHRRRFHTGCMDLLAIVSLPGSIPGDSDHLLQIVLAQHSFGDD